MQHKVLVVEDWGARTDAIRRAAHTMGEDLIKVSVKTGLDWVGDAPVDWLARFDSFLVDFDLSTTRPGARTAPNLVSISGEQVHVTTGMGAMLFLRDTMATPAYQQARTQVTAGRRPEQRQATIYSFVDLDEIQSLFFAAAAATWLDASFFKAVPDEQFLTTTLGNPIAAAQVFEARMVEQAKPAFINLMDSTPATETLREAAKAAHTPLETYDFLSSFYGSFGKSTKRVGQQAFDKHVDALEEVIGARWVVTHTTNSWHRELERVQGEIDDFLRDFGNGTYSERLNQRYTDDPWALQEVLSRSVLFWTAPDVRAGLRWHRARQAQDGKA